MAPSLADLATVRRWCGPNVGHDGDLFDDLDIAARVARLGDATSAALELLETIHAGMLVDDPAVLDIAGDYSESKVENLKQLERKIAECRAVVAQQSGTGSVTTSYLARSRPR